MYFFFTPGHGPYKLGYMMTKGLPELQISWPPGQGRCHISHIVKMQTRGSWDATVDFYFFYDGQLIFKYEPLWQEVSLVSDTQVTVKALGPLFFFF